MLELRAPGIVEAGFHEEAIIAADEKDLLAVSVGINLVKSSDLK